KDACLDPEAAKQLKKAADEFRKKGYKLVVFAAYRNKDVQHELFKIQPDNMFVLENSKHCVGLAVDLSLADVNNKRLDMGTEFDDLSKKSWTDSTDLTEEQLKNRELLVQIMEKYGF